MKVFQYSIGEIKNHFCQEGKRANKKDLAEQVALRYPEMLHELKKEQENKNPYHIRAFEAVALGTVYLHVFKHPLSKTAVL